MFRAAAKGTTALEAIPAMVMEDKQRLWLRLCLTPCSLQGEKKDKLGLGCYKEDVKEANVRCFTLHMRRWRYNGRQWKRTCII